MSGVGLPVQPDIPLRRADRLLVPAKGVDEAEGRDREQVGEETIMGRGLTSTPNKAMME